VLIYASTSDEFKLQKMEDFGGFKFIDITQDICEKSVAL